MNFQRISDRAKQRNKGDILLFLGKSRMSPLSSVVIGFDLYNDPSVDNFAKNGGALVGGAITGGVVGKPLAGLLSPAGHKPPPTRGVKDFLCHEWKMRFRPRAGKPLATQLIDVTKKGPTWGYAWGGVAGGGAGGAQVFD
jgi:hypothetical protein